MKPKERDIETKTKLQEARENAGLTLSELARRSGVSRNRLMSWEFKRYLPRIEDMLKVQLALFNVRPLIFERSIFHSDEEFGLFVNSQLFSDFIFNLNSQVVLFEEHERQRKETISQTMARWKEISNRVKAQAKVKPKPNEPPEG